MLAYDLFEVIYRGQMHHPRDYMAQQCLLARHGSKGCPLLR